MLLYCSIIGSAWFQTCAICASIWATVGPALAALAGSTTTRSVATALAMSTRNGVPRGLCTRVDPTGAQLLLPPPPTGLADGFGREVRPTADTSADSPHVKLGWVPGSPWGRGLP